jgi:hypothetical protein
VPEQDASPEWSPLDVHDTVTPSNPIELPLSAALIVKLMETDIERLEELDAESDCDSDAKGQISAFIERRREMIQWARAHNDEHVFVGIYPGYDNPEVGRECADEWDSEDGTSRDGRTHIVFWRLRQALRDDHHYWNAIHAASEANGQPRGANLLTAFQEWTAAAFEATHTLRYVPDLEGIRLDDGSRKVIERETWPKLLRGDPTFPLLSLMMAERAYDMTSRASFCCTDIIRFVIEERPAADVAAFLERLATLDLWGFDSEAYVLARSVLEAALKQQLPDEVVRNLRRENTPKRSRHVDLHERLHAAQELRLLSPEEVRRADKIRSDGNDAIHEFPNSNLYHKTTLELIRSLTHLLTRLLRQRE